MFFSGFALTSTATFWIIVGVAGAVAAAVVVTSVVRSVKRLKRKVRRSIENSVTAQIIKTVAGPANRGGD